MPTPPTTPSPDLQDQGLRTEDFPPPDLQDPGPSTQDGPLPNLSPSDASLIDALALNPSLLDLARSAHIPITDLLPWSLRPDIARWLTTLHTLRLEDLKNTSLDALSKLLPTASTQRETRLLATTILRELRPQSRAACVSTRPPRGSATRFPSPHQRPTSETGRPRPAPPRSGGTPPPPHAGEVSAGGMVPALRSHADQPHAATVPPSHAGFAALLGADQPHAPNSWHACGPAQACEPPTRAHPTPISTPGVTLTPHAPQSPLTPPSPSESPQPSPHSAGVRPVRIRSETRGRSEHATPLDPPALPPIPPADPLSRRTRRPSAAHALTARAGAATHPP